MTTIRSIAFGVAVLLMPPSSGTTGSIEVPTGEPRVSTESFSPLRLMTRAEYETEIPGEVVRVAPDRDPWSEMPDVRYAVFEVPGSILTLAVREGEDGVARFLVDTDRDGNLADEQAIDAEKGGVGQDVRLLLSRPELPVGFKYGKPDGSVARVGLLGNATRDGYVQLGESRILFSVEGSLGEYGRDQDSFYFDIDGDGRLDRRAFLSDERYSTEDTHVNLAGTSFEFSVSKDGAALLLEPLEASLPDRPNLDPGNPAPSFAFTDIDGTEGRLSDYRGKTVLLYVWGTWCAPCRESTPDLVAAYDRFKDRGFEILGIAKSDREESVRAYVEEHGVGWRQSVVGARAAVISLYRAEAVPSAFLIGPDGTILKRGVGDSLESLEELLGVSPDVSRQ